MPACVHTSLSYQPSKHAIEAGYIRPTAKQRLAATQPSGRVPASLLKAGEAALEDRLPSASTFPAPLVLPGDELSWDPKYPGQSLRSWTLEKARNAVTDERRTIYVVVPSDSHDDAAFVKNWSRPSFKDKQASTPRFALELVVAYLAAFYHGIPVKLLSDSDLHFDRWDPDNKEDDIALVAGNQATRIRIRLSQDGYFRHQLNLNDLLDVAIDMLPSDAYALLMVVHHDLYEDEQDDFCCGRAYGGSRVAVVSTARYNPDLDAVQKVETEHAWPASHCNDYVQSCCATSLPKKKRKIRSHAAEGVVDRTAMSDAVAAWNSIPGPSTPDARSMSWLARVCKTASHELGHCFGMDHCVYYACVMQGTAGLSEDARQPPYLCPVDLAKLLKATGADETEWCDALTKFSLKFAQHDRMFAAFSSWLDDRIEELDEAVS